MGSWVGKLFAPLSPVEENGRIIGLNEETCVDGGFGLDSRKCDAVQSMIKWCHSSRNEPHQLLQRQMIDVSSGAKSDDEISLPFRIMQWNILADALGSGKDNFIKCPPEAMNWNNRKYHILEEMLTYKPDIICCQEVDHFDDFLKPKLKEAGYTGAFLPKPWSPCLDVEPNNGPDGCAIFYRSSKFELVDYKAVTLKTMTFWTNHVALFHLLKFKEGEVSKNVGNKSLAKDDGVFLVGTTHLKAKVGYENLRATQGKDLLRYIEQYANIPMIICGDFNATPNEKVYRMFCDSESPYFESAYSCNGEEYNLGKTDRRREPEYTTWCIRPRAETPKTVDYLWYSKSDFRIRRILRLPTAEEITVNRLPSHIYPSDHLSLVCDIDLLPKTDQNKAMGAPESMMPKI